ncbi:hypothetical protein MUG84_18445 [Paenibacillus sp. KQZ6P-2]|uniref:NTF2-like N-terminal transpeptidase domain-containing protein n=1 Tax=Paenibacillus mangrovi TaxID=2931978 RepID=A0A9X2B3K7_9BACL|nr:NTF2-like N-terminal transpeptidase domain-containing protein [Paenibacillus mangrovi]MCJ8013709.1 hypothetical protein [Paenibacillus mangrovi]
MKSKQLLMYAMLSIMAASVLALYVYFFGKLDEQSPNETVHSYIISLQDQDFNQLYDLMTKESLEKSGLTREQFVQKYQSVYSGMKVSNIEISAGTPIKSEENSNYTVDYSAQITTFMGEIQENYKLILVQDKSDRSNTWKIQWQPTLILPDKVDGNKVKIQISKPELGDKMDRVVFTN